MGCTGIRSGTVSVVTRPSTPGQEITACSSRSPDTCGCTCQLKRMLTSSPMDLSMVSRGVTVASEEITDNFARTIVPTVTFTGSGARGTSVGTVASIKSLRRCALPMLNAMLSVWPSAKKAGACHSALRVIKPRTVFRGCDEGAASGRGAGGAGGGGAGGATVNALDAVGPGGCGRCEVIVIGELGEAVRAACGDEPQAESSSAATTATSRGMALVSRIASTSRRHVGHSTR